MEMPVSLMFWFYAIALSIHIVEESTVGGGFVNMVKDQFWPGYNNKRFFWFNTIFYVLFVMSIIAYDVYDGAYIILPLSFSWILVTNGLWHVIGTTYSGKYSPGLITTPVYWILMYFIIRYYFLRGQIDTSYFVISTIIGSLATILMIGSLFLMGVKSKKTTKM